MPSYEEIARVTVSVGRKLFPEPAGIRDIVRTTMRCREGRGAIYSAGALDRVCRGLDGFRHHGRYVFIDEMLDLIEYRLRWEEQIVLSAGHA